MTAGDLLTAEDLLASAARNGIYPGKRGRRGRGASRHDWSSLEQVVVVSPSMKQIFALAKTLGEADRATVLITGETGTGKELVARAIHIASPRSHQSLVVVNCGAMPKDLMEAELLGYAKGAFTGAAKEGRKGKIELAHRSTLFLDEIAELPPEAQTVLLRVLDGQSYYPVGSNREVRSDVRITAATNRDLKSALAEGTFREDLFYRLNVAHIHLPPLRERAEDILPLAQSFLHQFNQQYGKAFQGISKEAASILKAASWQGNVRELKNAVERVVLYEEDSKVQSEHLSFLSAMESKSGAYAAFPGDDLKIESVVRELIMQALNRAQGKQVEAAHLLGISPSTLRYRMSKYGLKSSEKRA